MDAVSPVPWAKAVIRKDRKGLRISGCYSTRQDPVVLLCDMLQHRGGQEEDCGVGGDPPLATDPRSPRTCTAGAVALTLVRCSLAEVD